MAYDTPPPPPFGDDEAATWLKWVHAQLTDFPFIVDNPAEGITFERKGGKLIPHINRQQVGRPVYLRLCKLDGTEVFAKIVMVGEPVLEASIPPGAEVYDPTP